jgi:hypothetical protein
MYLNWKHPYMTTREVVAIALFNGRPSCKGGVAVMDVRRALQYFHGQCLRTGTFVCTNPE